MDRRTNEGGSTGVKRLVRVANGQALEGGENMTIADKILEITRLALQVNAQTEKSICVHYSGYGPNVRLTIAKDRGDGYLSYEFNTTAYLNLEGEDAQLDDWIKRLESLLPVEV